jgi:predicted DNA binding CopG/RHH family protein
MLDGTVVLRAKTQSVMVLKGVLKPKPGQRVAVKDMTYKVTNKPKATATIPVFETEAQERAFWETHDSTDLLDWSAAQRVVLPRLKPSTQTISLRLPQHLLDHIKAAANARDVPYQSLIKVWLQEKVTAG